MLALVHEMHYNFEGEDSEKEADLFLSRKKENARQACQWYTLKNIDKFLHEREDRDGFGFQYYFGVIEEHMQDVGEDDDAIVDPDIDMCWKQYSGEIYCREYEWCGTVSNERN